MKIVFVSMGIILTLTVLAGLFLYLAGLAQPERHAGSITFTMAKPSTVVWAALTDYAAMPQWWPAVKKIRFETRPNGEVVTWDTDRRGRETGFRTNEKKLRRNSFAKSPATTCHSAARGPMRSSMQTAARS